LVPENKMQLFDNVHWKPWTLCCCCCGCCALCHFKVAGNYVEDKDVAVTKCCNTNW